MTPFAGEVVGTALLLLLGDGVVANVSLTGTHGHGGGLVAVAWGWAIAVFVAVFAVGPFSGAHLNPAVTVGLAMTGKFPWTSVPAYILAQFIGAFIGATLVWAVYLPHFRVTADRSAKLGVFCTSPGVRNLPMNFLSEVVATFVLVFAVLYLESSAVGLGSMGALPVALLVLGIGVSLGGTTGYAINPARDLAPRMAHALLPMPGGKRDSNWSYAWVPVLGPLLGATLAAGSYQLLQGIGDIATR